MTVDAVIYGVGPFARLMRLLFARGSEVRVVAFTADAAYLRGDSFEGLPVVPFEEVERAYPPGSHRMFVAIGYRTMRHRKLLFERAKAKNYTLVSYVSPSALISDDVVLGENNVLMGLVQVEPFVTIGDNNIFSANTLVAHDLRVGHHNYFSAQCVLGGASVIGDLCFFGNGAVTINDVEIADETHLLPGAVLLGGSKAHAKYIGNPARAFETHEQDGIIIRRG